MSALTDAVARRSRKPSAPHTATIWTIDIERFPMIAYQWSAKNRSGYTPERMVVEGSRMASFAALRHDGLVVFASEHHHGRDRMLDTLHRVMDSADILVGYNSRRFDVKHINGELATAGYDAPSPAKHVDVMQAVKRRFAFDYNSLGSVVQRLDVDRKMDAGGFDLWRRCMDGDDAAWEQMKAYNVQDVRATWALYERIRSWIPSHPNLALYVADDRACPVCASTNLTLSGTVAASTRAYASYRCGDCGSLSRAKNITARTDIRPVAVG